VYYTGGIREVTSRFNVDQIERDLFPAGHASRRSGVAIKDPDGRVVVEADPWAL
jgi:hypothetical protein